MSNKMYDGITGRSPIATDDLGYIGTGQKASQIMSGGTSNYDDLSNKPSINSVELSGNKTSADLGLQSALTETQTAAVNSGVTAETVAQVSTNTTNISSCQAFTNNARIDSDRKLYISATEPTGDIPINSTWINGSVIKTYALGDNLCDGVMEQGSISGSDGALIDNANRIRTSNYMLLNSGSYTVNFSPQKRVMCFKYDTSGAYIGRIDSSWNNTPYTFNLDDSYKIKFVVSTDDATPIIPSDITDIMLNTGTSAETYVPYGGSWT